jgi:carbamoyl-phosphate synthase large subunit
MAIGRTFKEALQKALRSLEIKKFGLESIMFKDLSRIEADNAILEEIFVCLRRPNAERIFYIGDAFRAGISLEEIHKATSIDPWFLHNIKEIISLEQQLVKTQGDISPELMTLAKEYGFSDQQLAKLWNKKEEEVSRLRLSLGIKPSFKLVDTCAAEFQAQTPYFYSTYEQ